MGDFEMKGEVLGDRCFLPVLLYRDGSPASALALAALLDTGAMRSAVTPLIAELLGLPTVGQDIVASPVFGMNSVAEYAATIEVPSPSADFKAWAVEGFRFVTMVAPMGGVHVLIGMDLIKHGSLTVADGIWRFRLPPPTP